MSGHSVKTLGPMVVVVEEEGCVWWSVGVFSLTGVFPPDRLSYKVLMLFNNFKCNRKALFCVTLIDLSKFVVYNLLTLEEMQHTTDGDKVELGPLPPVQVHLSLPTFVFMWVK